MNSILKNASAVSQIEQGLRSLTYIVPGRFRESEIASESRKSYCVFRRTRRTNIQVLQYTAASTSLGCTMTLCSPKLLVGYLRSPNSIKILTIDTPSTGRRNRRSTAESPSSYR